MRASGGSVPSGASVLVGALAALAFTGCASALPASAAPAVGPLQLAPASTAEPATGSASDSVSSTPSHESERGSERVDRRVNRIWGWFALSVGIDATLLAAVTSGMMLHEAHVRSEDCTHKVCSADGYAANGMLGNLAPWNATAWVIAVVGAGVGTFLLVTSPTDKSQGAPYAQAGIGPTGTGGGLLLRGGF